MFQLNYLEIIQIVALYAFSKFFVDFFLFEGFVKPLIASYGKSTFQKLLPHLYRQTDSEVLTLMTTQDEQKIITFIKSNIAQLDSSLTDTQIDKVYRLWAKHYNPIIAVKNTKTVN